MSASENKAVFLSYASQDAEAARRIAEALRGAGVEVWFDVEGGLEHGDEWDAKIRRQIKECVLFIAVISANTQAREEGYFRIEWELAAERAMGFASGVAFILPVVIDATREPDALVPDRFRKVQWTRLPGGVVTPEVQARLLKLWSHRTGALAHAARAGATAPDPTRPRPLLPARPRWPWATGAAVAVVLLAGGAWWFTRPASPASAPVPPTAPAAGMRAAPLSEARALAERAAGLYEALDSQREDFELAEDLLKQAVAKDGADAEVWARVSQLHFRFVLRGWDVSDQRRENARSAAQRALRLEPQSFEARLAEVSLAGESRPELEASEHVWRGLLRERPDDRRVLRALATVLRTLGRLDEGVAFYDRAAALPGGDPLSLYNKSLDYWFVGRTAEAEAVMRDLLAQRPFSSAWLIGMWYAIILHGDLDGARDLLARIPPAVLREDRGCYFAFQLHYLRGETDAALGRLRAVPRDWLNDNWYRGPKAMLAGDALHAAGRTEAAVLQWQEARRLVDERLAAAPTHVGLLALRVRLLAKLGAREEAARQFDVLLQTIGLDLTRARAVPAWVTVNCVLLGRHDDALRQIEAGLERARRAVDFTAADLRLHPDWAPMRGRPEFARLIARAEEIERAVEAAAKAKP
jgi:tetratricopeptide (TPR) repeat protein